MALESLKLKQISGFGDDAGIVTVQLCVVIVVVVVVVVFVVIVFVVVVFIVIVFEVVAQFIQSC